MWPTHGICKSGFFIGCAFYLFYLPQMTRTLGHYTQIGVTAFALFSLFFGAGNLILPPLLGLLHSASWGWVLLGFSLSAVVIPMMGIMAHARLQGSIYDFGKNLGNRFALTYAFFIYAISISLPSPRTAAVTHEMAIAPFLDTPAWGTSALYFILVFLCALNRAKLLDLLGKWLTPAIILLLLGLISSLVLSLPFVFETVPEPGVFGTGLLEGYQTFDAIGAVVVGGVVIISIKLSHPKAGNRAKRKLLRTSAWWAGGGLFLIYGGLILSGALLHGAFDADISRTALLRGIANRGLGPTGGFFMSLLIALACFTTAVGIVTGTADFISSRFQDSKKAYFWTAVVGCLLGFLMGGFKVDAIIALAFPALMFIYPITISLIVLHVLPKSYAPAPAHKITICAVVVFSIPDFLASLGYASQMVPILERLPLGSMQLGWVLPAIGAFCGYWLFVKSKNKTRPKA